MSTFLTNATEQAARLACVAGVVEAAGVTPSMLQVVDWEVTVQCNTAADVDRVMALLDEAPARWTSANYGRWATFDEVVSVHVFGPPRPVLDEVEACNQAQSDFFATHPRVEATS